MKTIMFVILLFPFLGAAAGQHCPDVRFLSVLVACRWSSGSHQLMYDLCMETLREHYGPKPSVSAEITEFALVAAQRALDSFVASAEIIDHALFNNGSLDDAHRSAYADCIDDYGIAVNCMRRVTGDLLPGCKLGALTDENMNSVVALEGCRTGLIQLGGTPLDAMNLADRNKQLLVFSLSRLLTI